MTLEKPRPGQKHHFQGKLELEIQNIWETLKRFHSAGWRLFSHADGLYLQEWSSANRKWVSKVLIDTSGNVKATGAWTGSTTLTDVGN